MQTHLFGRFQELLATLHLVLFWPKPSRFYMRIPPFSSEKPRPHQLSARHRRVYNCIDPYRYVVIPPHAEPHESFISTQMPNLTVACVQVDGSSPGRNPRVVRSLFPTPFALPLVLHSTTTSTAVPLMIFIFLSIIFTILSITNIISLVAWASLPTF